MFLASLVVAQKINSTSFGIFPMLPTPLIIYPTSFNIFMVLPNVFGVPLLLPKKIDVP
jgi:hypothetical protein